MDSYTYKVLSAGTDHFLIEIDSVLKGLDSISYEIYPIKELSTFKKRFNSDPPDLIVIETDFEKLSINDIISVTRDQHPYLPILLFSEELEQENTLNQILNGATDVFNRSIQNGMDHVIAKELAKYRRYKRLEENNRLSYDLADIGHWEINLKDDHIFWSDKVREIFGVDNNFEPTVENGMRFYKYDDDREFVVNQLNELKDTGGTFEFENEIISDQGVRKFIRVAGHALKLNDEIIKVFGTTQDITKEKETEQELIETKKFYELAVEGADVGLWEVDLETYKTFFSKTFYGMLGYSESDVTFTKDFHNNIIHPFDHITIEEHMDKIIAGKETSFEEIIRLKNKSGEYRWILDRAKVVGFKDGKPKKLAGSHIDITEQVLAERDSKNNLHRLELLIDASPIAIFQVNERGEIVEVWNKAAEEIFGFTSEEALGLTFDNIVELTKEDIELIRKVRMGEMLKRKLLKCRNRQGEERVLEVSTGPIFDTNHKLNQTLVLTSDVTEFYDK